MRVRADGLALGVGIPVAVVAGFAALGITSPQATAGGRGILAGFGMAAGLLALRLITAGVLVREGNGDVVVRSVFWSRRIGSDDIAGVAVVPVLRNRAAAIAVVTNGGDVVVCPMAVWRMGKLALWRNATVAAARVASLTGRDDTAAVLTGYGRLEMPAALRATRPDGSLLAVPAATRWPGLTPSTVVAVADPSARKWLRLETVVVALGFVLPALAAAITLLARHIEGVSELDEFDLPLPHDPAVSLVLMLVLYAATAVVTPIALLLLARSGQSPRMLRLGRRDFLADIGPGVGILLATFVVVALVALVLNPILDRGSLSTQSANSHVPAYFVIYALFVSAVTALNEELVVNAYLMTRLAQLGVAPWPALAISLALRTSYHAYYGLAFLLTVPFGYLATRSFQRSGRIGRPIVAHFLNDAILLTAAVLTN